MTAAPPYGRTVTGNAWDELDGLEPDEPRLVTAIVVHFEQPEQLARTLRALARQTHPRLEVIVVDDGSGQAPQVPQDVTLLRQEDRGFRAAAARNLGAEHANGDVLCFLDADTTPEPEYVARLTRLPSLAPEAVTVGRRRHADFAHDPPRALEAPRWLEDGYAQTRDLRDADARSYRYVISSVLACSAWFFALTGGFDESFDAYGGEDWEWAHRAWLQGAILAHVRDAVATHDGPDAAGRDPELRRAKNREALMLAPLIPVPGSAGHAVLGARADVRVELADAPTDAAAFVCVDSLLAALPRADVEVPAARERLFAAEQRVGSGRRGARTIVELLRPVRLHGDGLRELAESELDAVVELEHDGATLIRITPSRLAIRQQRWVAADPMPVRRESVDWLEPLDDEPDVEAHLGGWG